MKVTVSSRFTRQLKKCSVDVRSEATILFAQLSTASSLRKLAEAKKMKGHPSFWRIRINEYRIGLQLDLDHVHMLCIMHRKGIYKYFP